MNARASIIASLATVLAVSACGRSDEAGPATNRSGSGVQWAGGAIETIPSTGPVPQGCVRIEGDEIGEAGLSLSLAGQNLTFTGWTPKAGESGEWVGFDLAGASVAYAVKAGGETFHDVATSWRHPEGSTGSAASAISNITTCPTTPGSPDGGSGPTGGTPCQSTSDCQQGQRCETGICVPIIN